jgi:hypothetical protein
VFSSRKGLRNPIEYDRSPDATSSMSPSNQSSEKEIMDRRIDAFCNRAIAAALASAALLAPAVSSAQVAGSTLLGVEAAELRDVAVGWSARRQVLGKPVYNDANQKIGSIADVVIAPDKSVSYAIVATGGFLGVAKHDVAVPVSLFQQVDGKFVLAGATKENLKEMPAFEYAR